MSISLGSFTVGSGGDYATLNAALNDVVTLTGDLTFTVISSFTETVPLPNNFSIDVVTFNILINSNSPHFGVLGAGHIITLDTDLDIDFGVGGTVDSSTEIKNLQWKYSSGSFLYSLDIRMNGCNLDMHDNIFDMLGPTNRARIRVNVPSLTALTVDVYNNLFYNDSTDNNGACLEIDAPTASAATFNILNNVMDARDAAAFAGGLALSIDVTATALIANNTLMAQDRSLDNGATYPAGSVQNNACSDVDSLNGTVSPIQGFDPAVEFVSDVYGAEGYLQTAFGSQFTEAGVANILTSVDMTGASYGSSPPIGAYVAAAEPISQSLLDLFFRMFQHLWPISRAFDTTKQDKQFTQFNLGISAIGGEVKNFADDVYGDLFPQTTREIDAWELQWNLPFNSALTEQQRRDRIANAWSSLGGQSPKYIQDTIQGAGFTNVFIHEWWELPVVGSPVARNPNLILAGDEDLLVNIITFTEKDYITGLGEAVMECGEVDALCGQYTQFLFTEIIYEIPSNPALYPYFLYFGDATFSNRTTVPLARKAEFRELLLKICPAQQWLGLLIDYV